jgi:hypothetical protein
LELVNDLFQHAPSVGSGFVSLTGEPVSLARYFRDLQSGYRRAQVHLGLDLETVRLQIELGKHGRQPVSRS